MRRVLESEEKRSSLDGVYARRRPDRYTGGCMRGKGVLFFLLFRGALRPEKPSGSLGTDGEWDRE